MLHVMVWTISGTGKFLRLRARQSQGVWGRKSDFWYDVIAYF